MRLPSKWISSLAQRITKKNQSEILSDWKQHLISLYIIRNGDGICLYSHHFQLGLISHIENQLVGMGFTAITQMLQEIVDSTSSLVMIDLGSKKVLIEEKESFLSILITTINSQALRDKLKKLTDLFEKMFELQQRISSITQVRVEDYALTSDLVSMVFKDKPTRVLEIIPMIFKSIRSEKTFKQKELDSVSLASTIFHKT